MKSTGIVRRVDSVGRFVVPAELRDILGIQQNDPIEIFTEDDKVILKKYQPSCIFCGSTDNVITYKGKLVCQNCIDELKNS